MDQQKETNPVTTERFLNQVQNGHLQNLKIIVWIMETNFIS